MAMQTLKFLPMQARVDVSFWTELSNRKLDTYKLSEAAIPLRGYFCASRYSQVPTHFFLDGTSFVSGQEQQNPHPDSHSAPGILINTNTKESFVAACKEPILSQVAGQIWSDIKSGNAELRPDLLLRFLVITHADLKYFHFHYWFAFPALKPAAPYETFGSPSSLMSALGKDKASVLALACDAWYDRQSHLAASPSAASEIESTAEVFVPPFWLLSYNPTDNTATAYPLSAFSTLCSSASCSQTLFLAFSDPCHLKEYPGGPLRNALTLAQHWWKASDLHVVAVRQTSGRTDPERSLYIHVRLPDIPVAHPPAPCDKASELQPASPEPRDMPAAVGWEANAQGKLAPQMVDLSPLMAPEQLADQAVDLNLRLMRWRAAPALEVLRFKSLRCLLLGAGTLGCAVARTLMAWGVRHITLLDSSRVSYSNPVRQSLYTLQDCVGGGKPKAAAAAAQLREIFPSVEAAGVDLTIPMPGHPPGSEAAAQKQREAARQLDQLVRSSDVVFLLTDTRESRWLPALLCAAHGKLAITSAVGFDSFVVMRHGGPPTTPTTTTHAPNAAGAGAGPPNPHPTPPDHADVGGESPTHVASGSGTAAAPVAAPAAAPPSSQRLGCYFCNDVVAPLNSTDNRTLDQQCTVARPGLAAVAGSLAVELMAAVVTHPDGVNAPAPSKEPPGRADDRDVLPLGPAPHMVRGALHGFSQTTMEGCAFSQCTACSRVVVEGYRSRGEEFVLDAVRDARFLERVTGLDKLFEGLEGIEDVEEEEGGVKDSAGGGGEVGPGERVQEAGDEEQEDWTEL